MVVPPDTSDAERASLFDCEKCLQPAEAFSVVGNETRLAILEALWAAPERPVTFSELRSRVGMADSAQCNYHLYRLTGQFVAKTTTATTSGAPVGRSSGRRFRGR